MTLVAQGQIFNGFWCHFGTKFLSLFLGFTKNTEISSDVVEHFGLGCLRQDPWDPK